MKALSQGLAAQVHASYHLWSIPQAIEELIFNSEFENSEGVFDK
jgi:hypothetical protein